MVSQSDVIQKVQSNNKIRKERIKGRRFKVGENGEITVQNGSPEDEQAIQEERYHLLFDDLRLLDEKGRFTTDKSVITGDQAVEKPVEGVPTMKKKL